MDLVEKYLGEAKKKPVYHHTGDDKLVSLRQKGNIPKGKKVFRQQHGIGKAKYTVSKHDGKQTHKDGSPFYDIAIFKNKKALDDYIKKLKKEGYVEE